MVITDTDAGENDVFYCDGCVILQTQTMLYPLFLMLWWAGKWEKPEIMDTPNTHSIEDI